MQIADFEALKVYDGVADYHLNRFRTIRDAQARRPVEYHQAGLVRYLAPTFSNLSALQADTQYRDMLPLYPTILPPPS
jgi:hypothetical protein